MLRTFGDINGGSAEAGSGVLPELSFQASLLEDHV
jgi:hypothetical protein